MPSTSYRIGGMTMRAKWYRRSLIVPLIALLTAVACGTGSTQSAGSVKVIGVWSGQEQLNFMGVGEPLGDGKLYQIFSWAAVKGLIWYSPKNFTAKNYQVPKTYDDLLSLQSQIKSSGTTPWCIAIESGSATGWPASDWLKEIVLSQAGPDVYDKWVAGTQKWSSPEIKTAFQTFGKFLGPGNSNVYGGAQNIIATNFGHVGKP